MPEHTPTQRDGLRILRRALILLLIALIMVLVPSFAIHSYAQGLPMDESGGLPPLLEGYKGDDAYQDRSIDVRIEKGRFEDSNWIAVHVKISHPSQLRTLKAGRYGSTQELQGAVMAKRVQAVLAMGGDFFVFHNYGYIVRQGQFYRNKPTGQHDVLVIDQAGDFHLLLRPDQAAINSFEQANKDSIVNAFTFGPALIRDGQPISDMTQAKTDKVLAQRIALCQTGPLSYLIVYTEGPNDPGSLGMDIPQFTRLVASFPGVVSAYNLDGGSSATIVFQNQKINGPLSQRSRAIGDIIYFASMDPGQGE